MGTTEDVETIASFKCPLLFHCTPTYGCRKLNMLCVCVCCVCRSE